MTTISRLVLSLALCAAVPASAAGVGSEAPACGLRSFDGTQAIDIRQLRGKIVYVDFWASWCASCVKSFPFLNALDREFRERGLHILGVNVDEQQADAVKFLEKRPATFALAADPAGSCPSAYGVTGMPSSYLIDRAGRIREIYVGFRTGESSAIRARVAELLAEST